MKLPLKSTLEELLSRAAAQQKACHFTEAERLYREALAIDAGNAFCNYSLGILCSRAGRAGEAVAFFDRAVKTDPSQPYHWLAYGRALGSAGKAGEAIAVYRQLACRNPDFAEGHFSLGNALRKSGCLEEALQCFRRVLDIKPDFAPAYFSIANIFLERKELDGAAIALTEAIKLQPGLVDAHTNLGNILLQQKRISEALEVYGRALLLDPKNRAAHNNLGVALRQDGQLEAAMDSFRKALALDPHYAEAYNNLGIAFYEKGDFPQAVAQYRCAIARNPHYAQAYDNLGNALMRQTPQEKEAAIAAYRKAIEISPDHIQTYDHLALALCEMHKLSEAFSWFTRAALSRFEQSDSPGNVPEHKKIHDEEQGVYLGACGHAAFQKSSAIVFGEAVFGPTINLAQPDTAERQWTGNRPQIVVIDDLLTQPVLEQLRLFCLGSRIWQEAFQEGYLGARPESGFACPLLAQIAEELPKAYPAIFGDHPLLYSWAFKYDSRRKGTKIHADFAAVNVNFWITPDEANSDPESGGLVIWDVAAPLDWDFATYNRDEERIRKFLAANRAKPQTIAYRSNRAVIFDSDLFHETDRMAFRSGYQNRRINITLLYGRRAQAR